MDYLGTENLTWPVFLSYSFIDFRRIEASKDIAQTLSQNPNVTYLPSQKGGSNMLLGLNTR